MQHSVQPVESARRQIAAAAFLIAEHQPTSRTLCSCGRLLPCTVATASSRAHDHNSSVLALLLATMELPTIATAGR
ncbi:hypothetical protein ACFQZ4_49440 [Catellatospora coxensis]|uniref:hypothetical protein n=1 Tax=Catellatospora coxensis TaxID=310354 RepID=UPI00194571CA|nr:hypothetical protein [Catellatospora coxensis]